MQQLIDHAMKFTPDGAKNHHQNKQTNNITKLKLQWPIQDLLFLKMNGRKFLAAITEAIILPTLKTARV